MSEPQMRVAIGQFSQMSDELLRFGAQLGVSSVQMNSPLIANEDRWSVDDLRPLVESVRAQGMVLEAIENVPLNALSKAMVGGEGAAEQIENYKATIRAMGEAGIPVLGYNFMPNSVWSTSATEGRGGAKVREFDLSAVGASASGARNSCPPDRIGLVVWFTPPMKRSSYRPRRCGPTTSIS